ncbi:MAG: hypothetical protein AAF840_13315 [Bacteroidota bacterium]
MNHLIRISLFFIACALSFTACDPAEDPITPVDPIRNSEWLNFQEPVVGQFNTFEALSYECGEAMPAERWDLRLEITAVTPEMIEFTESPENGDPQVFTAAREEGILRISAEDRQKSRLFFFYGSDSLRLEAPPVRELTYRDCVFFHGNEKFTGDIVASLPNFELDGKSFKNQKVVSCVPTILDLDGYIFYDKYGLTASISTSTSEFGGQTSTFTSVFLLKEE